MANCCQRDQVFPAEDAEIDLPELTPTRCSAALPEIVAAFAVMAGSAEDDAAASPVAENDTVSTPPETSNDIPVDITAEDDDDAPAEASNIGIEEPTPSPDGTASNDT
jgi:hypothetical protein